VKLEHFNIENVENVENVEMPSVELCTDPCRKLWVGGRKPAVRNIFKWFIRLERTLPHE
jgi:hypothetical protein